MNAQQAARTAAFTVMFAIVAWLMWMLREVMLLVGFAALLAFALDPLVTLFERIRTPWGRMRRDFSSALVILVMVALGVWALAVALPQLAREFARFIEGAPASLERFLAALREFASERGAGDWLGPLGGDSPMTAAEIMRRSGAALLTSVLPGLATLAHIVGLALIPILAFYLLAEREAVERSALQFIPEEARPRVQQILGAVDRALRSYVRGQSIVCVTMGTLVGIMLAFLHVPVPILLGTVVAVAEVVPILGFWTASLAIVLAGWATAPQLALWGWLGYVAINQMMSLFITPRVMGRHMKLHPFVVMVSILAGGTLLGAAGAALALPLAAAVQSLVSEFARRPEKAIIPGGPV